MIYGIKHLTILPVSTNPSPTSINHLPLRADGKLTITEEPIKDYLDRALPNWINFKVEAESYYNKVESIGLAHSLALANQAMCELVTEGNEGVFKFASNQPLGYDFEFTMNKDIASIKHTLEAKFENAVGKAIIGAAVSNTRTWSANQNVNTSNYSNNKITNFNGLDGRYIKDFNFKFSTKGEKTIDNKSIISTYDVMLEIITHDNTASKISEAFDLVSGATINFAGGFAIVIFQNTLFPQREAIIGSKEKSLKITWAGQVPINAFGYNVNQNWIAFNMSNYGEGL